MVGMDSVQDDTFVKFLKLEPRIEEGEWEKDVESFIRGGNIFTSVSSQLGHNDWEAGEIYRQRSTREGNPWRKSLRGGREKNEKSLEKGAGEHNPYYQTEW